MLIEATLSWSRLSVKNYCEFVYFEQIRVASFHGQWPVFDVYRRFLVFAASIIWTRLFPVVNTTGTSFLISSCRFLWLVGRSVHWSVSMRVPSSVRVYRSVLVSLRTGTIAARKCAKDAYKVDKNRIILDFQFGFKQSHSKTQQIIRHMEHSMSNLNISTPTASVFLDVKKHSIIVACRCNTQSHEIHHLGTGADSRELFGGTPRLDSGSH